jgi:hypothetical protein
MFHALTSYLSTQPLTPKNPFQNTPDLHYIFQLFRISHRFCIHALQFWKFKEAQKDLSILLNLAHGLNYCNAIGSLLNSRVLIISCLTFVSITIASSAFTEQLELMHKTLKAVEHSFINL